MCIQLHKISVELELEYEIYKANPIPHAYNILVGILYIYVEKFFNVWERKSEKSSGGKAGKRLPYPLSREELEKRFAPRPVAKGTKGIETLLELDDASILHNVGFQIFLNPVPVIIQMIVGVQNI